MDLIEKIYDDMQVIKVDVAGIKEHLRILNGTVKRNQNNIEILQRDNVNNKIRWAKVGGVSSGITAIVFIAFKLLELI